MLLLTLLFRNFGFNSKYLYFRFQTGPNFRIHWKSCTLTFQSSFVKVLKNILAFEVLFPPCFCQLFQKAKPSKPSFLLWLVKWSSVLVSCHKVWLVKMTPGDAFHLLPELEPPAPKKWFIRVGSPYMPFTSKENVKDAIGLFPDALKMLKKVRSQKKL